MKIGELQRLFADSQRPIASHSDSSAGKSTLRGPTAPRCRYADDAPGPPLKTNVTGRSASPSFATYDTEKISADGLSFLRRTIQPALAVYSMVVAPAPHVPVVS